MADFLYQHFPIENKTGCSCTDGTISERYNNVSCETCPQNTFNNSNMASCEDCPTEATSSVGSDSCTVPVWIPALAGVSIFAIGIILGITITIVAVKIRHNTAKKSKCPVKVAYHVKRSAKDEIVPGGEEEDDGIYADMDENEITAISR